jgi:hypothetical protein
MRSPSKLQAKAKRQYKAVGAGSRRKSADAKDSRVVDTLAIKAAGRSSTRQ